MNFILIKCKFCPLLIFFLFVKTNTQDCGINPPNSISDCFNRKNFNETDSYCCYLENENSTLCKLIPTQNYNPETEFYYYNSTKFSLICDVGKENSTTYDTGNKCGLGDNPSNSKDCTKYSLDNNSCCFYNNTNSNISQCFWMGIYSNEIFTIGEDSSYIINCSADYYFFSGITLLINLFILLALIR